jgi:hypothetical protein
MLWMWVPNLVPTVPILVHAVLILVWAEVTNLDFQHGGKVRLAYLCLLVLYI